MKKTITITLILLFVFMFCFLMTYELKLIYERVNTISLTLQEFSVQLDQ